MIWKGELGKLAEFPHLVVDKFSVIFEVFEAYFLDNSSTYPLVIYIFLHCGIEDYHYTGVNHILS